MKVAVLKGGRSLEREVSLRSGANAEAALRRLGHEVLAVDADPHLVRTLRAERPDAAFIALHGKGGEDGTVQELLEILEIPYTGPGVLACERAMDKVVAKAHFTAVGIDTPKAYAFRQDAFRELGAGEAIPDIRERLGLPLIVKPASQGSALGISVVRETGDIANALMNAFSYDERVLMERFVAGRELAVSVIGTADAVGAARGGGDPPRPRLLRLRGALHAGAHRLRRPRAAAGRGGAGGRRAGARLLPGPGLPGDEPGGHDPRRRGPAVGARDQRRSRA